MQQGIKIEGLKELYNTLKQVPVKVRGQILRNVNKKIIKTASNALKSAIIKRGYKNRIKEGDVITVNDKYNVSGVLVGLSTDSFPARFIEGGTVDRYVRKRNTKQLKKEAFRGKVKADPFLVPAIDSVVPEMLKAIEKDYPELIYKALSSKNRSVQRKLK